MAYEVSCSHCSARFSLTADLYARKIKGRISTIRCPRCSKDTTIDDSAGDGRAPPLKPLADVDSSRRPEPISERRISYSDVTRESLEAVVELAALAPKRLHPPPVPRKTPELAKKALWIVSYAEDDDRELTVLQIRSALVRGEVTRDSLVWQEGMPEWIAMGQVPELAAILPRAGEVLKHRMPSDKSPRRPSSHPPPKREGPVRMPAIPGSRAMKPLLPTGQPSAEGAAPAPEEKARTRPDLPKPRLRSPPAEAAPVTPRDESEPPPSSGSPALRSLTQKVGRVVAPQRADEPLFGMQSADRGLMSWSDVDASRLTAPAADDFPAPIEAATPAAPPERRRGRMKAPGAAIRAEEAPAEDFAPPSPRASAPPLIDAADAAGQPARTRSPLLWLLLLAGLMFGVAWLLLRSPWAAQPRTEEAQSPAAVVAAKPANHAAPEQSAPPTEPSAAPADSTDPQGAGAAGPRAAETPEPAEEPRQRARTPVASAPERSPTESTTPSAPAKRPAGEPTARTVEPAEPPAAEPSRPAVTAPFDKTAAVSALNALAGQASACRQGSDPSGIATVVLTFAPSGRVTSATVNGPPFAGTSTGGCVARTLRRAHVPAFSGEHVTVSKTVLVQ
ncbi:MAG TPA: GYF domain-containing protein [Polyangiaceae bacterium]